MEKKITFRFGYIVEGHVASGNVDTYFYSNLPNVETEVADKLTGFPVTDIPPIEQSISVRGSSVTSCATVATIIKDYLQNPNRKSVIAIRGKNKQIEFEGPNLKADTAKIEAMIYNLTNDGDEDNLTIMSYYLPELTQQP